MQGVEHTADFNQQGLDVLAVDWLTVPLLALFGLLLVLMPYYTRVRRHQRMDDEAFRSVGRWALFTQTCGVGFLAGMVGLFFLMALEAFIWYETPGLFASTLLFGFVEFHLLARWLQSLALGSRHRRLRRGRPWDPPTAVQYILAYPAFFSQMPSGTPTPVPIAAGPRSITPGLDPVALPPAERHLPATFQDILDAVHRQVEEANARAIALEEELTETRRHVTRLEHDLIERRAEIVLLEAAQNRFEVDLDSEIQRDDGKALSMSDSVIAGDAFVGSTVIDRHIVNDPEAIARAVLDAYRSGRGEA